MLKEDSFINKQKPEGQMEQKRTKEEAQQELIDKFGLRKTSDFQSVLRQGKIELAEDWLRYIVDNKLSFPQYLATWDSWLSDREWELTEAKKIKS